MQDPYKATAGILMRSQYSVAFTGAGISVESGIPPFRGAEGLWSKYDPRSLELDYFYRHPLKSWQVIREIFYAFFEKSSPNMAHHVLARMEQQQLLRSVVTQNIDNLHQEAGSERVIEYHGNSRRLKCIQCGATYTPDCVDLNHLPPRCKHDDGVLKPDIIFFGEMIPPQAHEDAVQEASRAEVLILVGTTGEVMPAAMIPRLAKSNGARIIEINPTETHFTNEISDIFLKGKAGEVMSRLAAQFNMDL